MPWGVFLFAFLTRCRVFLAVRGCGCAALSGRPVAISLARPGHFVATGVACALLVCARAPGRRIVGSGRLATGAAHVLTASPPASPFALPVAAPVPFAPRAFAPRAFAARASPFALPVAAPVLFAPRAFIAFGATRAR